MKRFLFSLLCFACLGAFAQNGAQTKLAYFGLKGRVHTIRCYEYMAAEECGRPVKRRLIPVHNGPLINTGDRQDFLLFNEKGWLQQARSRNSTSDSVYGFINYTYDTLGRLLREDVGLHQFGNLPQFNTRYRYDSRGRMLDKTSYDNNYRVIERAEYGYHGAEALPYRGQVYFRQDTTVQLTYLYTWDSLGWITKINIQLRKGQPSDMYPENNFYHGINTPEARRKGNYYVFQNDAQGNWTNAVVYRDGRVSAIIERLITYY